MTHFTERHADKIMGVSSCFDRVIIQGTLPDICHPRAITNFFNGHGVRIFDFKQWAAPMRDKINENIKAIAEENGIDVEIVRKQQDFRKEQRVKEIIAERGDHPGIVHIFKAMESCTAFKPWHDKQIHATFFKYDSGRCMHYYVYFIDKQFGLCYLRIPTWARYPSRVKIHGGVCSSSRCRCFAWTNERPEWGCRELLKPSVLTIKSIWCIVFGIRIA